MRVKCRVGGNRRETGRAPGGCSLQSSAPSDTLGGMCRAVTCRDCGKPTWKGCGAHVEQVLAHVPPAERCHCRSEKAPEPRTTRRKSWFARR